MSLSSRARLTALLPAGNEERHLADCIASVRFADEVLVALDAASHDATRALAARLADRVIEREYGNSASQKNWAIPQAAHEWVLIVDCDERVTPELRAEIERTLADDAAGRPVADGYRIRRRNHFIGEEIKGCGWQRDTVLRLFRRDRGRYEEKNVHADVIFPAELAPAGAPPARVESLRGELLHFTFDSFDQYLGKYLRYTDWAGEDRALRTPRVGYRHLALRPIGRFLRQYILFGGWRDGKAGFVICVLAAFSVFLKYARVWEKRVKEQRAHEDDTRGNRP